jgi:hypothetical protein
MKAAAQASMHYKPSRALVIALNQPERMQPASCVNTRNWQLCEVMLILEDHAGASNDPQQFTI